MEYFSCGDRRDQTGSIHFSSPEMEPCCTSAFSTLEPNPVGIEHAYAVRPKWGDEFTEGYNADNLLASYVHAHWASNPSVAAGLVESCAQFRARN